MIWSRRSGYCIHCDIVNPRRLELEAAKEILAKTKKRQYVIFSSLGIRHITQSSY
jgi:hypothetical protein